jgi:hypothetical protein
MNVLCKLRHIHINILTLLLRRLVANVEITLHLIRVWNSEIIINEGICFDHISISYQERQVRMNSCISLTSWFYRQMKPKPGVLIRNALRNYSKVKIAVGASVCISTVYDVVGNPSPYCRVPGIQLDPKTKYSISFSWFSEAMVLKLSLVAHHFLSREIVAHERLSCQHYRRAEESGTRTG